jgi:alpha-beta hydrolase superfamily lysophospholipase
MPDKNTIALELFRALKKPFFGRFQRPWVWPEAVPRGAWTAIAIPASRGTKLAGYHAPALTPSAKGTVVCAHAMGNEAKASYLKRGHAELLRRNGYNVLVFDFNGFGESESSALDYPADVVAAGKAAKALWPSLPVAALGISFGAAWSICALADHPGVFDAAVLESAFTTLEEYWVRYPLPYAMIRAMNVLWPTMSGRLRPISKVAKVRSTPLLLIYSDVDEISPPSMGERFLRAARPNNPDTSLWLVRGAEHTKVLQHDERAYEERIVAFLDRAFAKVNPHASNGRVQHTQH